MSIELVHEYPYNILLNAALSYPEAWEDHPWGDTVAKVGKKLFFTINFHKEHLYITCKLPESNESAVSLPFAAPAGYGLGKSGWVTCTFTENDDIPVELILDWLDESYRAIAQKKLVKVLDEVGRP
ncbi:MAG: MmcQ/YjbR family DNA-binding protein [Chthonomonadales bacterium]